MIPCRRPRGKTTYTVRGRGPSLAQSIPRATGILGTNQLWRRGVALAEPLAESLAEITTVSCQPCRLISTSVRGGGGCRRETEMEGSPNSPHGFSRREAGSSARAATYSAAGAERHPPKPMRVRFGGVAPGLPPPSRPCASPRSASSGRRAARGGLVRCPVRAAKNTNHPRHEVNRADRAETATVLAEENRGQG